MGHTITEKILASHSGESHVAPGDIVMANLDLVVDQHNWNRKHHLGGNVDGVNEGGARSDNGGCGEHDHGAEHAQLCEDHG